MSRASIGTGRHYTYLWEAHFLLGRWLDAKQETPGSLEWCSTPVFNDTAPCSCFLPEKKFRHLIEMETSPCRCPNDGFDSRLLPQMIMCVIKR